MTAPGASITIDNAAVTGAFARLVALAGDLTRVLDEVGQQLATHVDERFEDEQGPGGVPWRQSWRAKEQGGQTLTDTSRLRKSVTHRAGADFVEVGTNVAYAATHQFGADIKAKTAKGLRFKAGKTDSGKAAWRRMMQVTIPARPFLGFDSQDQAETLFIVERAIDAAGAGGAAPA